MLNYVSFFKEVQNKFHEVGQTQQASASKNLFLGWQFSPFSGSSDKYEQRMLENVLAQYDAEHKVHQRNVILLLQDCCDREGFNHFSHYLSVLIDLLENHPNHQPWFDTQFHAWLKAKFSPEWAYFDDAFASQAPHPFESGLLCGTIRQHIFQSRERCASQYRTASIEQGQFDANFGQSSHFNRQSRRIN